MLYTRSTLCDCYQSMRMLTSAPAHGSTSTKRYRGPASLLRDEEAGPGPETKARRKSQSPFSSRRDQSIFIISLYQVQSQFNFHSVQRIKQSHIIQVLSNDILPKVLYEKRRNLYLERSVHRKENINIYILDLNQRIFPTCTVSV